MHDEFAARQRAITLRFRVGKKQKKHKGLYLRLVIDTGRGKLTAYLNGLCGQTRV